MKQLTHTHPVSLGDWHQWHQGIRHYAVWCLPVDDPDWLAFIDQAQTALSPWLHPGYARQPHITLFAAGLVDKNHYRADMQAAQIKSLELYSLSPVLFTPAALSTFPTAPWLGIEDVNNQLESLRSLISKGLDEDSPAFEYQPHITLGFYRDSYPLADLTQRFEHLSQMAAKLPTLQINQLHLCYYDTREIQGTLTVEHCINLLKTRCE